MPKIKYQSVKFRPATKAKIDQANEIIAEYQAQGLDLTLRQLYYQFVSRGLIPNNDKEYDNLGGIVASARLAGLIDWDVIEDRTRFVRDQPHWSNPQAIVEACSKQFRLDKWDRQPEYVEVWIEKDALIGVIEGVCKQNDVPYLACRGYASASEVWRAGHERIRPRLKEDKAVTILYLGDHDPSGLDMTRDVRDRLKLFAGDCVCAPAVERLALNMDQIEAYNPPPNPTKMKDSRATAYVEEYGHECWELDALDPAVIRDLISEAILQHRDEDLWEQALEEEKQHKAHLAGVAENWDDVVEGLPQNDSQDEDE